MTKNSLTKITVGLGAVFIGAAAYAETHQPTENFLSELKAAERFYHSGEISRARGALNNAQNELMNMALPRYYDFFAEKAGSWTREEWKDKASNSGVEALHAGRPLGANYSNGINLVTVSILIGQPATQRAQVRALADKDSLKGNFDLRVQGPVMPALFGYVFEEKPTGAPKDNYQIALVDVDPWITVKVSPVEAISKDQLVELIQGLNYKAFK
jgi:hypothetical protein